MISIKKMARTVSDHSQKYLLNWLSMPFKNLGVLYLVKTQKAIVLADLKKKNQPCTHNA